MQKLSRVLHEPRGKNVTQELTTEMMGYTNKGVRWRVGRAWAFMQGHQHFMVNKAPPRRKSNDFKFAILSMPVGLKLFKWQNTYK